MLRFKLLILNKLIFQKKKIPLKVFNFKRENIENLTKLIPNYKFNIILDIFLN